MKPKPYPPTDSSEQDAKTVLESLVYSRFVKLDIRTRDKYPNVDGTVELVLELVFWEVVVLVGRKVLFVSPWDSDCVLPCLLVWFLGF